MRTVVEGCNVHNNGIDGVYLCWRVQKVIFRNNRIYNYGESGISIGHKDTDNYFESNIIHDNAFCRISAFLLIPKGLTKPQPAIVVLHDHGGMFYWGKEKAVERANDNPVLEGYIKEGYSGQPVASMLAKRGYVVLVIDSLFFGERRYDLSSNAEFVKRLESLEFESEEYIRQYNYFETEVESDYAWEKGLSLCSQGRQAW